LKAISEHKTSGNETSRDEKHCLAKFALLPIVGEIEKHWDRVSMAKASIEDVDPFAETLKTVYRRALRRRTRRLERLAVGAFK
jgi:type III secretory pathway component EscR